MRNMLTLLALMLTACATGGSGGSHRLITPEGQSSIAEWSEDEKSRDVAVRNLRRSDEASFHLLRIQKDRKGTVHEQSDLVVSVISGRMRMTVDRDVIELVPGDVVEIPRDTPYALSNRAESASVAYLVYTPALDPADSKPAPTQSKSAWRWNLWAQ